jgi:hypothetical protein
MSVGNGNRRIVPDGLIFGACRFLHASHRSCGHGPNRTTYPDSAFAASQSNKTSSAIGNRRRLFSALAYRARARGCIGWPTHAQGQWKHRALAP